jgi:Putative auto-transporter adhesin, head GIN domain
MTRTLLALFALGAAATPAAAADRRYSVTDFDRVTIEGPYVVRLTTGRASTARATGSQAALDRVAIDVQGQTLRIRRGRSPWSAEPGAQEAPLTIELTTRTLRAVRLAGPGNVEVDGIEGLRVDLAVVGSGRLRAVNIAADTLALGLLGSGRLELAGTAETLSAELHGTGEVEGSELRAENATIVADTMGNVTLTASETANVNALGLGRVTILGRPDCTVRGDGAGQVRCGVAADRR